MPGDHPFPPPAFAATLLLTVVIIARRGRGKPWFGLFTPITIMLAVSAILIVIGGLRWRYGGAPLGIVDLRCVAAYDAIARCIGFQHCDRAGLATA